MKQKVLWLVLLLFGATVGLAMVQTGDATFNAATGFSGRHGFTCTSCHNVPDRGPLGGEQIYDPPAQVVVEGVPERWDPEASYRIEISVTGGPPALAAPAPQGGFEIEADAGFFSAPSDMADLVDVYTPGAVTYTVAGAMVREWAVVWHPPPVNTEPQPVTFWIAAMAANGNHVVAAGASDGGELLDSVDNTTARSVPSPAAMAAWYEIRMDPPTVTAPAAAQPFEPITLTGTHTDPDATHLGYRIDEGTWERMETGVAWTLRLDGLTPGEHAIWLRSEAGERRSEPVEQTVLVSAEAMEKATPFPMVTLFGLLLLRRRP